MQKPKTMQQEQFINQLRTVDFSICQTVKIKLQMLKHLLVGLLC